MENIFFQIMNQFLFNKNGSTKLMLERCFKLLFVDEKHKKHMFHLLVYWSWHDIVFQIGPFPFM